MSVLTKPLDSTAFRFVAFKLSCLFVNALQSLAVPMRVCRCTFGICLSGWLLRKLGVDTPILRGPHDDEDVPDHFEHGIPGALAFRN